EGSTAGRFFPTAARGDLVSEGHSEAQTPRLAIAFPKLSSHVEEQVLLRFAGRSFASMAHEQGEGAFLEAIDRADHAVQSAREEGHPVESVVPQTFHRPPDEI